VELLGSGSGALTLVGEELARQGAAGYAASFLTDAARDPEAAQDPMLWVAMARAHEVGGNRAGATVARNEADLRARVVLESVGQLAPLADGSLSPEMQQAVLRYLQAGNYYGEIKGEPEKALTILREACRLAPDSAVTRNALGYTLADKGTKPEHFDEALALTKKAAEQMPESGSILDSYGWALYKKNDLKAALRVLADAAEAEPETPEIHYHLGMALQTTGQLREAKLEFDRALLLRPDYAEARRERDRLR
jgi:Flp pilus assembly protein TadD